MRYALDVAEMQPVQFPFRGAVITVTPEKLQCFQSLKAHFELGCAQHPAMKDLKFVCHYDLLAPKFLVKLPDGFVFEGGEVVAVPDDFDGMTMTVRQPRLQVDVQGVRWHSEHYMFNEGSPFQTAILPWETLGL